MKSLSIKSPARENIFQRGPVGIACAILPLLAGQTAFGQPAGDATTTLPTIHVDGSAAGAGLAGKISSGSLGDRDEIETPFSIKSVTAREIEERQAFDLNSVFTYDATASASNSGRISQNGAIVRVRGLTPSPLESYKIDSLSFPGWFLDLGLEHFESVDLLKGVSGFAYGFGVPSGIFNYITKKPTRNRLLSVDIGYKSDRILSTHLDAGGRFGADHRFGYRFNVAKEKGENFNDGYVDKISASLGLDARLTPDLKLTLNTHYLDYDLDGFSGSFYQNVAFASANTISGRTKTGIRGLYKKSRMGLATLGAEWSASPDWFVTAAYRHADFLMENANVVQRITRLNGDYDTYRSFSERKFFYDQAELSANGQVRTGWLRHRLVLGLSWQRSLQDDDRNQDSSTFIGSSNIFGPNALAHGFDWNPDRFRAGDYEQRAVFASDTLELTERLSLLAGVRYTDFQQKNWDRLGQQTLRYSGTFTTPTLAAIYRTDPQTAMYASVLTKSMQAGGLNITPGSANYGSSYPPLSSKQYEVGVKTDRGNWSATAALFRIDKGTTYVDGSNVFRSDGTVRHQGLEFNAAFQPVHGLTIAPSLAWLDARYEQGAPAVQGRRSEGTSRITAAIYAHYQVASVQGLAFNAGARYSGKSFADAANTRPLTAYTVLDAGASYATRVGGRPVTLRAAVRNLTGRQYWTVPFEPAIQPGEPRNVTLNARIDF